MFVSAFNISATYPIISSHLAFGVTRPNGKPLFLNVNYLFQYLTITVVLNTSKRGML